MKLGKKIILSLIILIMSLSVILSFAGCKKRIVDLDGDVDWDLEILPGEDVLKTRTATIDTAVANGTDQVAAALHLFDVAEKNMVAAPYYLSYSFGSGSATTQLGALELGGDMTVISFNVNNGDSYGCSTGVITKGSPESALTAAKALLEFAERSYYDKAANVHYKQRTGGLKANANFSDGKPIGEFFPEQKKTKSTKWSCNIEASNTLFKEQERVRRFSGEKTNHVLSAESIEKVSVSHNEAGYYTVKFSFKLDDFAAENYTNLGRDSLRESAGSDDLKYVQLDYSMEIYDCGYFKNYGSIESWDATLNIMGGVHGASLSNNIQKFSWKKDDCDLDKYDDWVKDGGFTFAEATPKK